MLTRCKATNLEFQSLGRCEGVANFVGGTITSDAGGLLLREVAEKTGVLRRFADCFTDHRDPELIEHTASELVAQRIHGLVLGYEDVEDHDGLRHDPLHGHQLGRFFHGYYRNYCYLSLYIFCGVHLLAAKLRPAGRDASAGSIEELARIVAHVREEWPRVKIIIRADSGFCRERLMAWCAANDVEFVQVPLCFADRFQKRIRVAHIRQRRFDGDCGDEANRESGLRCVSNRLDSSSFGSSCSSINPASRISRTR